jgi:ABC-type transport system involved in cytochrome c biogenesis permease subunit
MQWHFLGWLAVALYVAAEGFSIAALLKPRSRTPVTALVLAGLLAQFADLDLRARSLHSVPYRTLEGSVALFAWMLGLSYLALLVRHRERGIGPFLIPLVILFSALSLVMPGHASAATPETRGSLFALHVTFAIFAYAAFTVSFVLSILYLVQNRQIRRAKTGLLFARLPSLEAIGRMNRTSVAIGLSVLLVSVALGAVWARRVWLHLADPKLAWALITLVVYAFLLWMDRRGWEGRRVALLSILGFGLVLFSYTFVNLYFSTEHAFR